MRLACSSAVSARALGGGVTQLEWLEAVARLPVEGVAFDVAHFPRDDAEYAAQLRKIAVDLGVEVVALDAPGLLDPQTPAAQRERALALAAAIGAPLIRTRLGPPGDVPPAAFAAGVAAAKAAVRAAKVVNVTLAVAPAAATLGPTLGAVRRLVKDVDSAWLRYAAPALGADREALGARDRVVLTVASLGDDPAAVAAATRGARGPLLLTGDVGGDALEAVARWADGWRQSTAMAV